MMDSVELFSGTGGLALGLALSGFHHKALYEWDKDSCNNLIYNIENGHEATRDWKVFQADVRSINFEGYSNSIQLLAGGPPCQPFSLGGKHEGHNDRRDMWPEAIRAVREIQPPMFIFENVKGLLRKSFSSYFNYILLQLNHPNLVRKESMTWEEHLVALEKYHTSPHEGDLSYNVVFRLLNAADYGVPQVRQRVIIVGFRSDYDANWSFPKATNSQDALLCEKWITKEYWPRHNIKTPDSIPVSPARLMVAKRKIERGDSPTAPWKTVRDAIGDLPDPRNDIGDCGIQNHEYRPGARLYAGHTGSLMDEPSKTIKAGAHGVPGGENTVILDDGSVRYYTVRESARIQTFPDNYLFSASWTESMRQIGNAVPVELATAIGSSVYQTMERKILNG